MAKSERELRPTRIYPWVVLVGIALLTATGVCTVLANASLFIPSVIAEKGYNVSEFTLWITCYQFAVAIAMLYAGNLWQKIPTPILLTTCLVVSMVCFALFGFADALWQYYVLASIIGLVGGVYFLVCAPFVIPNWFAKRQGFALGLGGLLAAVFTAILTPIQSAIIATVGWHWGYVGVACLSLVISLPFTLFIIRYRPADKGLLPYGYDPNDVKSREVAASGTSDAPGVPLGTAVKSLPFVVLFVIAGAASLVSGLGSLWNAVGVAWGYPETFGAAMVSAAALFGVMNPVVGFMIDKIKATRASLVTFAIVIVAGAVLLFAHTIPVAVLIGVFFFCCYGCITVSLVPYMALQVFGPKSYTKLCSYLQIGVSVLGAFSAPVMGMFYDTSGSYDGGFVLSIGICTAGFLLTLLVMTQVNRMKAKWQGEEEIAAAASGEAKGTQEA